MGVPKPSPISSCVRTQRTNRVLLAQLNLAWLHTFYSAELHGQSSEQRFRRRGLTLVVVVQGREADEEGEEAEAAEQPHTSPDGLPSRDEFSSAEAYEKQLMSRISGADLPVFHASCSDNFSRMATCQQQSRPWFPHPCYQRQTLYNLMMCNTRWSMCI